MKKEEFIERRGEAAYARKRECDRVWEAAHPDRPKTRLKILHRFGVEGVRIVTQYVTTNRGESFHVRSQFDIRKGYSGKYKGKNVMYTIYCPRGFVRHHNYYNDFDYDDGVVFLTRSEHIKIHPHTRTHAPSL